MGWRAAATLVVAGLLVFGTFWGSDDMFPFGPMKQFAFRIDPDGCIHSNYLRADTTDGRNVRVPWGQAGVGLKRAELEGKLSQIFADPSVLQEFIDAQRQLHPFGPHYETLYVMRDRVALDGGHVQPAQRRIVNAYWDDGGAGWVREGRWFVCDNPPPGGEAPTDGREFRYPMGGAG